MPDGQPDTIQQAKADLPQPQFMGPGEGLAEGTKLGKAYDAAKSWLDEHSEHLSEKYLAPFRQGLDNMAADLQQAAESGHTKSGGQLTPTTRALVGATGELLKQVPVGKDVGGTLAAGAILPEINFENLEGHELIKEAPEALAYRARPVGQKGVPAGERPVATSSVEKAQRYKEDLENMTGQPHEVVQVPLKAGEHTKHVGPDEGETWYSFKKGVQEEHVKPHEPKTTAGGEGGGEPPKPKKPAAPEEKPSEKPSPKDVVEKAGLVYKGKLTKDSDVHMFEHPDHPGKTASLNEDKMTPESVKSKMDSKLKEFGVKKAATDKGTKGLEQK